MTYKFYIKIRIRMELVEEKVHQILTYVQEGSADIWKENILVNLELGV